MRHLDSTSGFGILGFQHVLENLLEKFSAREIGVVTELSSPKDPFVSPKEGISLFSYDLGMGLEASILFDPGGVWILRVEFSVLLMDLG